MQFALGARSPFLVRLFGVFQLIQAKPHFNSLGRKDPKGEVDNKKKRKKFKEKQKRAFLQTWGNHGAKRKKVGAA
jgi:hypothetical protein